MKKLSEEEIEEVRRKLWTNNTIPLFSSTGKGIISDQTANYIIGVVMIIFMAGLIFIPNDIDRIGKWWEGTPAVKEEEKNKFKVPQKGGVLQNMSKDSDGNIKLKLGEKIKISDDTFIFRFNFANKDDIFGLPIGQHVVFTAKIDNALCQRKYTPISEITRKSYIDFLIKVYKAGVHPKFPQGGIMRQYVDSMKIG